MSMFLSRPSSKSKEAVKVLQELLAEEGLTAVDGAIAEVLQPARLASFGSKTKLEESQGRICAKRLVGKKCTRTGPHGCECNPKGASDHVSLWKKNGKPSVYVAQPYSLSLGELADIVDYCQKYGLDCSVDAGRSWRFPGQTLQLELWAKNSH